MPLISPCWVNPMSLSVTVLHYSCLTPNMPPEGYYRIMVKNINSGPRLLGLKSWLCQTVIMGKVLICASISSSAKREEQQHLSHGVVVKMKLESVWHIVSAMQMLQTIISAIRERAVMGSICSPPIVKYDWILTLCLRNQRGR